VQTAGLPSADPSTGPANRVSGRPRGPNAAYGIAMDIMSRIRRRNSRRFVYGPHLAAAGLVALGVASWQLRRLFVREPEHTIEARRDGFEIRRYAPARIAETDVGGTWEEALGQGFRRLASFIFGSNTRKQRIAMTAPVTATREGDGYRLAFAMPEGVDLPRPDDEHIAIHALPSRRVAVLRFRGRPAADSIESKKRELLDLAEASGYVPRGEPTFAGYDPPWTVPLLRRNEVWVEIER
jgi:hypothetical protein